jgi:branched-chain amino acid transport system substrate-binding protein
MGDFIFRACYKDSFQGTIMAKFAAENLNLKKIAIIYDISNDYCVGIKNSFVKEFKALGGEIVAEESYSKGDPDFNAQLTQIKRARPDALFIPDYYEAAGPIMFQAWQQGINVPFLGVDGWDSPEILQLAGGAEEGAYFVNHYSPDDDSPATQEFIKAYKDVYGKVPDAFAALGYDTVCLVADAITRAGSTDRIAIKEALGNSKDVVAATGTITLDAGGSPIKDAVILQFDNGSAKLVAKIQ